MDKERILELIKGARRRITLKRQISAATRADLGKRDFVFPETRSFPIQKPADVGAAVSSWGRANAVRARGFTFDDFKQRLTTMAKRKGASFVAALPAGWKVESKGADGSPSNIYAHGPGGLLSPAGLGKRKKEDESFEVFKDADGRHRWVMVSSSAYIDRDREIVSTKALTNAVAEHDATGERGPLRWWHVRNADGRGLDLGDCDFGMVHGRLLTETGLFYDEDIGAAIKKSAKNLSASIGFEHPKSEPVRGIFDNISIFERSILPKSKASNLFASISVKENNMATSEKVREFIEIMGPKKAAKLLGDFEETDKGADAAGFRFKEHEELSAMRADELLEYSLLMKEHEESEQTKADSGDKAANGKVPPAFLRNQRRPDDDDDDDKKKPASGGGNAELLARLNKMMGIIESQGKAIKALQGSTAKKETDDGETLDALDGRLNALEGEQPRAVAQGYRASQQGAPVEDKEVQEIDEKEKAWREAVEANPHVAPFADTAKAFGDSVIAQAQGSHPYWGAPPANGAPAAPPMSK